MAKLILTFDERTLKETPVGTAPVIIGRLPHSTIVIDNPAVSAQHARVFRDGATVVIEDLQSANGTFVNETLITRAPLNDGDVVLIGKHQLIFSATGTAAEDVPVPAAGIESLESQMAAQGGTVMLDTRKHRELMAKSGMQPAAAAPVAPAAPAAAPAAPAASAKSSVKHSTGLLRVLTGRLPQSEYLLTAPTSLIGKSDQALVRLTGWFKPHVALAIARKPDGYAATPLAGKVRINGQRITSRHDLRDGDVIEVGGITLEFRAHA